MLNKPQTLSEAAEALCAECAALREAAVVVFKKIIHWGREERTCRVEWEDCNPYIDNANDCWEPYCSSRDYYLRDYDDYTYCPGCGAKIIKEENDGA